MNTEPRQLLLPDMRVNQEEQQHQQGGGSFGESTSGSKSKPQMTPQQILDLYNQQLPTTLATTVGQAPAVANTLAGAAAGSNPIYTQSVLSQLNNYAGGYQQAGGQLAQMQGLTNADLIAGSGGLTALEGAGLNQLLNPVQAASNTQAQNLVNSINLNGLSPGEYNAGERSLNQSNYATGNLGLDNATNSLSNAMNFGDMLSAKRAQLGSALGVAGGVSANQQTQVNPVGTALGAGNTSTNFGLGTFNPTQGSAAVTAPLTFGGTALGGLLSAGSTNNSKSNSQSVNGGGSGGCCFIFLEVYHGVLPVSVRKCRDRYYRYNPKIAVGYTRMAKWLVPMMKQSTVVRNLVWRWMVKPLTQYGEFVTRQGIVNGGRRYRLHRKVWFTIWNLIGGGY